MQVKLDAGFGYFNRGCVLCGDDFETCVPQAVAYNDDGSRVGLVCPVCVEAGPEGTRDRMRAFATGIHAYAADLERTAAEEAIDMPSADEWRRRMDEEDPPVVRDESWRSGSVELVDADIPF